MENLFETKEWNRDNLRLICGDLYACMNGQQWVLLWDEVDGDNEITDWNALRFRSWDSTYTMYITDDRRVKVYKDSVLLRYITFDKMVDRTYSKYFNDDPGVVLKHKDIAMMLNAATTVKNLCLDDIFSIPSAEMFRNVCVFDEILFVNVSGKKWYPIFTDIACVYDRAGDGIAAVNNTPFPSRVIIPNEKHRTLDIFRIISGDGGELKHIAVYDKEHIKKCAESVRESHGWKMIHYLFESELNRDATETTLMADNKPFSDNVNAPDHYKLRGLDIEAIDVIRGALDEYEFRGFCKGNVLKYTIREGHKNGDEDLKKAKKYLEFLEEDYSDE